MGEYCCPEIIPVPVENSRIDFYVLKASEPSARLRFACRLAEKTYKLDRVIHIHTSSEAETSSLDDLLWVFRDGSFVPHELSTGEPRDELAAPITIGHGDRHPPDGDVLISLTDTIPAFFDQFERVAEILDGSTESRKSGRERYRIYKDTGHEPTTHMIA